MTISPPSRPVTAAEAAAELLRRREARRGLLPFSAYTFPAYAPSWHHRVLCDYLDRFAAGEIRRLMVFMPPQHGKSEHVSRRLPARILGQRPTAKVIACSYTAGLAGDMSKDVQNIMSGPRYRALYPGSRLGGKGVRNDDGAAPARNREMFEVIDADGNLTGGSYKCAGVGGGITGKPMDVGIIDDPIKGRAMAESPADRERVWGWYNGDFLSRTHNGTGVLVTCTRWHEDDLPGRLLKAAAEDPKADQWVVVSFPAVREDLDNPDDPRPLGEALWPAKHSLETLEAKRASSPYDWSSLYQQQPRGAGSQEWPAEYFGPHLWFDDWPPDLDVRVLSLDPSKGKADKSGDYSAFVSLGVDSQLTLWVDADLDNTRPVEPLVSRPHDRSIVTDGIELCRTWGPAAFVVETNGFQELVAHAFARHAAARNLTLPIYTSVSTEPKPVRIRSLGVYLASRRLRVRNTKGGRMLVQQMRDFPTGLHDDAPDALALAVKMASRLIDGRGEGRGPELLRA